MSTAPQTIRRRQSNRYPAWIVPAAGLLILIVAYAVRTPQLGYDGAQYLTLAQHLHDTGTFSLDGTNPTCGRAPGYPVFLGIVLALTGGHAAAFPLQLLFLLATYWILAWALRACVSPRWRNAVFLTLVCIVPLHNLALTLDSEPLFLLLNTVGIVVLVRGIEKRQWSWLLAAGVLFGLSAYVRPVNTLATVVLAVGLVIVRRVNWKLALLLALAGLATITPWTIRNFVQFHRLVPMAAHVGSVYYMTDADVFWPTMLHGAGYTHTLPQYHEIVGDDSELSLAANDRYLARAIANIKADPLGFAKRCLMKTVFVWSYLPGTKGMIYSAPWLFGIGVLVQWLFLFISWRGWRRLRARAPTLASVLAIYTVYTILVLLPFYGESRFLLPLYIWYVALCWYWLYDSREKFARWLPARFRTAS